MFSSWPKAQFQPELEIRFQKRHFCNKQLLCLELQCESAYPFQLTTTGLKTSKSAKSCLTGKYFPRPVKGIGTLADFILFNFFGFFWIISVLFFNDLEFNLIISKSANNRRYIRPWSNHQTLSLLLICWLVECLNLRCFLSVDYLS